jgi:hypothetical protein
VRTFCVCELVLAAFAVVLWLVFFVRAKPTGASSTTAKRDTNKIFIDELNQCKQHLENRFEGNATAMASAVLANTVPSAGTGRKLTMSLMPDARLAQVPFVLRLTPESPGSECVRGFL